MSNIARIKSRYPIQIALNTVSIDDKSSQDLQEISWKRVRFGDVAKKVDVNVDRETCGLNRYIAGEHMHTDDLHLNEWGDVGDNYLGPAFHKKFTAGQILYGSRRTYLRKVAIPHFDGICANTTFVIEPTGKDLLSELVPFVMQSSAFTEHSINESKGSTNPYVNWKDIAKYEFFVPMAEDLQRKISIQILTSEEIIVKNEKVIEELTQYRKVVINSLYSRGIGHKNYTNDKKIGIIPNEWDVVSFNKLYKLPSKVGVYKGGEFLGNGIKLVRMTEFFRGNILNTDCSVLIDLTKDEINKYQLVEGDLLFGRRSLNIDGAGKCVLVPKINEPLAFESSLIRVRLNQDIASPYFYLHYFNGYGRKQIKRLIRSVAASGITTKDLSKILVPLPPRSEQLQINAIISKIEDCIFRARINAELTLSLKKHLIDQSFPKEVPA